MEFDENKAVEYINSQLVAANRKPYDADEVLNVIDMIWDFYEENGLLDIDASDDEADEEDLTADIVEYVRRMLRKDKDAAVRPEDVPLMVEAELAYEDSVIG